MFQASGSLRSWLLLRRETSEQSLSLEKPPGSNRRLSFAHSNRTSFLFAVDVKHQACFLN